MVFSIFRLPEHRISIFNLAAVDIFIFNWAKVWNFLLWLGWSTNLLFLAVTGLHTSREKVINIPNKFIKNRKNQGKSQKYSKSMMEL